MSFRDKLNDHPAITTLAAVGVIVIGAIFIGIHLASDDSNEPGWIAGDYFTTDDGQTLVVADITNRPPFKLDGKTAVKAHVYSCNDGKSRFTGYLERYTPEGLKKLDESPEGNFDDYVEVKKPREGNWVKRSSKEGQAISQSANCPDGKIAYPITPD